MNKETFDKVKQDYLELLENISDKFYLVKHKEIPTDTLVVIKTDKGYISNVIYDDSCKEVFKDWNTISWITSDEVDRLIF